MTLKLLRSIITFKGSDVMSFEEKEFKGIKYLIKYPEGFDESKTYPALMFLHGTGSRGETLEKIVNHVFFKITNPMNLPFVIFAPLCKTETLWLDCWERLEEFSEYITELPFVDKTRFYLTGASMGGYATWSLAMCKPHLFAAIAPVCGGGMCFHAMHLKNVPVWAFHGTADPVVSVTESINLVERVNKHGGNAKLTLYEGTTHDAWTPAYKTKELYDWFLSHSLSSDVLDKVDDGLKGARFG